MMNKVQKTVSAILAAAAVSFSAVGVQAASRTQTINSALSDISQIHILYNDKIVQYDDVLPVNTDGRVMIPFRAALESMGATVDYDEETRTVTATKGDITVTFTLMDDTIYIDNNGEKSTITMDVPMIIVNDRTLVPIRFMSNALGMQVGWNGDNNTVVIMDYDDYFDTVTDITPNLTTLSSIQDTTFNKEYASIAISYAADENNGLNASFSENNVYSADAVGSDITFSFKSASDGANYEVSDVTVNAVVKDGKLYFKTNLIGKVASLSDSTILKLALSKLDENSWYSIDINTALQSFEQIPDEVKSLIEGVLSGQTDMPSILMSTADTEGDADYDDAIQYASMFDMLEQLDKYVVVTEKEDGGYTTSVNITETDLAEMIAEIMGVEDDETKALLGQELLNTVKQFNVSITSDADAAKQTTNGEISLGIANFGQINLTIEQTQEKDENAEAPEVPSESTDVTSLLVGVLNGSY